ncbi:PLDc_N domain-containing protein [Tenacibaculum sp. AHE15PA]|uniref:PLDc N-terminal domain-containing protein n=1 Tax=unclassified Tenacibaculum TaxID=2635139 RepID=UPI001C4FC6C1|nr:PLDc_N domain-containing protein [Tenacibaculum sp. AHE14PA]QXP76227.1 PLDc_N domain-containing protein [Tenacibaculum sp. AHE15PA]
MNPFLSKVLLTTLILVFITLTVSIIDITKSKLNRNDKIFWVFVVLLFNIFGTITYFIIGKKKN